MIRDARVDVMYVEEPRSSAGREPISFAADRVHVYENFGASEARYHNVIIYEHV